MATLRGVIDLMDGWYPPHHADDWDRVGLICGDPDDTTPVRRILLAVDPTLTVAQEAVEIDADLVITHHPLFLKGTSSVAATTPKGRVVHTLLTAGCALFNAHTNADSPAWGVSDSLARALGLTDPVPLQPDAAQSLDTIVAFVPEAAAERVREAMAQAGAGALGDYDGCSFSSTGEGRFRPLEGAEPAIGSVGTPETVPEVRIEVVCRRESRAAVLAALRTAHPYEEPAITVTEQAAAPDRTRGSGRIGTIEPMTLRDFATRVAEILPQTAHGVRVAGDPDCEVRTVALCGGAGDFLLQDARAAGADVYLTSDLRHHPASELREHDDLALIDVAHWAAEWTWLPVLAQRLRSALGDTVEVAVSTRNTDAWTFRV